MTTTSSSTLKVGFAVAEEANVISIVCHKVGIDGQNPELDRALEYADACNCV